jgi:hypothetical protein
VLTIPSWLQKVALVLDGGQYWPQGNEDLMKDIGEAWQEAATSVRDLNAGVGSTTRGVLDTFSGSAADQFGQFATQLQHSIEPMAGGAEELGQLASQTGLEIETSKYMILMQMIVTAEQIAEWSATLFGLAVVPEIEVGSRLVLARIAAQLVKSVAAGTVSAGGIDAAAQLIEMLKGDRSTFDLLGFEQSLEMGALGGALSGALHLGAGLLAPALEHSIAGSVVLGAVDGVITGEAANAVFGDSGQDLGLAAVAGAAAGGLAGAHGHAGGGDAGDVKVPDVEVPDLGGDVLALPAWAGGWLRGAVAWGACRAWMVAAGMTARPGSMPMRDQGWCCPVCRRPIRLSSCPAFLTVCRCRCRCRCRRRIWRRGWRICARAGPTAPGPRPTSGRRSRWRAGSRS